MGSNLNLTPDDIIKMSLASGQGILERRADTRSLINQQLNAPTGAPPNAGFHEHEGGHGDSPYDNEYGLEPGLLAGIQRLQQMSPFGSDAIRIGSGYRSYEEQERLYNDWINGVPGQARAAPPGRSNHNHGMAADLEYASPEVQRWVASVAPSLGLHFPVSGENWHVERSR